MSLDGFPSGCVLDRRVRVDEDEDDDEDLIAAEHPFSILSCVDKQAFGFHGCDSSYADEAVRSLDLGVYLADAPPDLSCLALRGGSPLTSICAVDKNVMIFTTTFPDLSRYVYLIYDAITGSLRMIPLLESSSSRVALTSRILIARPRSATRRGGDESDYALVLTGKLAVAGKGKGSVQRQQEHDSLFLWRPLSSRPWSEIKRARFPDEDGRRVYQADEVFACDGHGYWADLLCGVMYCSCDAIFDKEDSAVEFGFFNLPFKPAPHHRYSERVAQPVAYRTMGTHAAGKDSSTIRFVSISGFLEDVALHDRTVTVWRLLGHAMGWEIEHQLRLGDLWQLEGFGDLPKDMTPMYPLLSTEDEDVIYFALGEYTENRKKGEFAPTSAHYLLAINMRHQIILSSVRLPHRCGRLDTPDLISCDFSRYLRTVTLDMYLDPIQTMNERLSCLDLIDDEAKKKKLAEEAKMKLGNILQEHGLIDGKCGSPVLRPFLTVDHIC